MTDRLTEIAVQLDALGAADFNAGPADVGAWLDLLAGVERTPGVSPEAAAEARQFLAHQRSR